MTTTWQQERAHFALTSIDDAVRAHRVRPSWLKELRQALRAAPSMVQSLGIGTTMAMMAGANSGAAEQQVYQWCQQWLTREGAPYAAKPDLFQALVQGEQSAYFLAQTEALVLLVWLKKLIVVRVDPDGAPRAPGAESTTGAA